MKIHRGHRRRIAMESRHLCTIIIIIFFFILKTRYCRGDTANANEIADYSRCLHARTICTPYRAIFYQNNLLVSLWVGDRTACIKMSVGTRNRCFTREAVRIKISNILFLAGRFCSQRFYPCRKPEHLKRFDFHLLLRGVFFLQISYWSVTHKNALHNRAFCSAELIE